MKNLNYSMIIVLILSALTFAQKGKWQDDEAREKFEQLEKIKIIETLELDEETTLRFFSRRAEHKKQQDEIHFNIQQKIDNLDVILKSGNAVTDEEIQSNIAEINTLQLQFEKNRADFINSLSDIMSYEQISKLIIFEKQFRNEVRKLIMKERRPPKVPE